MAEKQITKSFKILKVATEDDSLKFSGYLSTYEKVDRHGDVIRTGAFTDGLNRKSIVSLLYQHNSTNLSNNIGDMTLTEDEKGLFFEATLDAENDNSKIAYNRLKSGAIDEMSVGMMVSEWGYDKEEEVWNIYKAYAYEGSLVLVPANPEAMITEVKQLGNPETKENKKDDLKETKSEEDLKKDKDALLKKIKNMRRSF